MKSERMILQGGSIAAFCFGGLQIIYSIFLIISLGTEIIPVGEVTPDWILALYQNDGYGISIYIKLVSFLFLIPALISMFFHLKKHAKEFVVFGFAFGGLAIFIDILATTLQSGLIQWLAFKNEISSFTLRNDVFLIHRIIHYLQIPLFIPMGLFLVLTALAFRTLDGYRSYFISWSLILNFVILLAFQVFSYFEFTQTSSVLYICSILVFTLAIVIAGTLIFKEANQKID